MWKGIWKTWEGQIYDDVALGRVGKKGDDVIDKRKYNSVKSDVKWSRKGVVAMVFEGRNIPFIQ